MTVRQFSATNNMRSFVFVFIFDVVVGINPCADNSKFQGDLTLQAGNDEMTCTQLSEMLTDFTPSDVTCSESVSAMGTTNTRVFFVDWMAEQCCQQTPSGCDQFATNICTDKTSLNKQTVVFDTPCSYQMEQLRASIPDVSSFTPDATTCAQTVEWRWKNMSRVSAVSTLSACCGGAAFKCSSHVINPCKNPSDFQASSSSCLAAAADIAPFTASASTCSETIERTDGRTQQRKFALHEVMKDCCGGKEVLCTLSASESALSMTKWAKAGDSMCFAKSNKSLSATAVGACSGSPMTSYFEQEMDAFKIISGANGAYLTNSSLMSDIKTEKFALDANWNNECCAPATCGMRCQGVTPVLKGNYALVQTGMTFGDPDSGNIGGAAGIGYYAIKSGSVQTNVGDFLTNRGDDGFRMSRFACLKYDPTASAAAGNGGIYEMHTALLANSSATTGGMPAVCGAATKYTPGQIKFSIYLEFGGHGLGKSLQDLGATYISFRSKITTTSIASVFFNNNPSLTLDSLGSQGVASVTFASATHNLTVAFEEKYISGRIIDVTGNPTPTKPLSESTVTIKAAKIDSTSFYVDYLFQVTESMRAIDDAVKSGSSNGGQYLVYDPSISVQAGGPTGASTGTGSTTASQSASSGAQLRKMSFEICFLCWLFLLNRKL